MGLPDKSAQSEADNNVDVSKVASQAYSLGLRDLAEVVRASKGVEMALYTHCFNERVKLYWGRIALEHMHSQGVAECEAIRLANDWVGMTLAQQLENALSGKFEHARETDEAEAHARADSLVDSCLSAKKPPSSEGGS